MRGSDRDLAVQEEGSRDKDSTGAVQQGMRLYAVRMRMAQGSSWMHMPHIKSIKYGYTPAPLVRRCY